MAVARLCAIFILILYLKDTDGQQAGLSVKPGTGLSLGPMGCQKQALQRKSGLVSNPNAFSQLSKPSTMGCSCNLKQQNGNLNVQQTGLQSNLQQTPNCQQPVQQQQNLQQSHLQSLPINLQQQLLQQQQSIPVTNWQIVGQQPQVETSDISFSSMPIVNGQISSLPSQVSQGVLLSNLGLTSSLPSILPNSCNCKQQAELPMFMSQNSGSPISNTPFSVVDGSQFTPVSVSSSQPLEFTNQNNQQISFIPVTLQSNVPAQQNQPLLDFPQNSVTLVQNQPPQNQIAFNPVQLQQVTPVQSQPMSNPVQLQSQLFSSGQNQPMLNPVQFQPQQFCLVQNQPMANPVQLQQPINSEQNQPMPNPVQFQSQPISSGQNQPISNPVQFQSLPLSFVQNQPCASPVQLQSQPNSPGQNQPTSNPVQLQPQPINLVQNQPITNTVQGEPSLSSLLLSQIQSSNAPPQNSAPSTFSPNSILNSQSNNPGTKSSSIKALLPLLFNLLKEKNTGCGCPTNFNNPQPCGPCGVRNNNFNNNTNGNEPQVSGGYSNLINYGRRNEDTSSNNIGSEESSKSRQRKKHSKYKYRYDDSLESTEADDEYDFDNED